MTRTTQHTPGPWNCHAHDWKGLSAGIVRDKNNDPIADCRYTELPRDRKPAEVVDANAHLIAAAPAMYTELGTLEDCLVNELHSETASREQLAWMLNRVRKIRAQAEGRGDK